jgi:hypothetical protein
MKRINMKLVFIAGFVLAIAGCRDQQKTICEDFQLSVAAGATSGGY